ncbi:centromere protein I [Ornithorhynchus anatinus]|nr:centromere protein I [Ornithorhynchus anatinus]
MNCAGMLSLCSQKRKRVSRGRRSTQTDLAAWRVGERTSGSKPVNLKTGQKQREEDFTSDDDQAQDGERDSLRKALRYFEKGQISVPLRKNPTLQKHLETVENVAWRTGLPPESIDTLLNVALSGRFAEAVNTRLLKCMIPTTLILETSIVAAVSWLCVGKCSGSNKILFFRWLIAMFDFVDHKEQINSLYGFIFAFLQDENLCPYICHLLYLLTRRENVKPFRVRKLLDLQAKMGMQPHLQALLSLYKFFCPELVSISLSTNRKTYFKDSECLWKTALSAVRQRNQGPSPGSPKLILGTTSIQSRRRKWNTSLVVPLCSSQDSNPQSGNRELKLVHFLKTDESFPPEQLHTFSQLLQNAHCLELPSQMGSVLKNSLLLHYLNCIKDESVLLRLHYWINNTLKEDCIWHPTGDHLDNEEFKEFLNLIFRTECFLQEGFSSCEKFLYKSLPSWDGFGFRSQILPLVTWIPLRNFSEIKALLCEPLAQLFFTSSIYFKCSILQTLRELLQNWLLSHATDMDEEPIINSPLNTTLAGLVNSVAELIHFVGWMSTNAVRLENNSTFLMHFILNFYETVCDIHLNYNLPLVVLLPPGIFYPALLSMDAVTLNRLCYIMFRYRANLVAAKENELIKKARRQFNFSSRTYKEFNQYVIAIVDCLWTSKPFQNIHSQGISLDREVLEKTGVPEVRNCLNIVHHPALLGYAALFLQQGWPEKKELNLSSIKGKKWNWYLEYLYSEGLHGLKLFIESSINRVSSHSQT